MIVTNHVVLAVASCLAGAALGAVPASPFAIVAAAAGGVLPDIDEPRSWLGRRLPFLSYPINALFGHRGATHSLIAVIALAAALSLVAELLGPLGQGAWYHAALPFLVGYASHLLGDLLTPSGVPLFWPSSRRQAFPLFPSADFRRGGTLFLTRAQVSTFGSIREAATAWGALIAAAIAWLAQIPALMH